MQRLLGDRAAVGCGCAFAVFLLLALPPAVQAQSGCPVIQTVPEPSGPGGGAPSEPGGPGQGTPGGPNGPGPGAPGGDVDTTATCSPGPSGTISAAPSTCNIDPVSGVCASTITWNSTLGTLVRVKVTHYATGTTEIFATGSNGSLVAPWITSAGERFDLVVNGDLINAVDVVGNPGPSGSTTPMAA